MENGDPTRRSLLKAAAFASTALAAPFARGAFAAGKLACGFWDHWVPGANDTLTKLCKDWGEKEKVDVAIDYITSQGDKNLLTIAAEAQSHSGHDILAFPTWYAAGNADNLELVDDIVSDLTQKYGKATAAVEYLGKQKGQWIAVPATVGTQSKPPCARIDLFKQHVGLDLTQIYPAGSPPNKELADRWRWDFFLQAAEKCSKADASNNKWLISGKGALIMNPPSAWAVAKRDAPQIAEQLWTFDPPTGPKGRYDPFLPYFWGIWKFSGNKPAAKSLLAFLSQRPQVEQLVAAAKATICRLSQSCAISRPGPRRGSPRVRCTITRRARTSLPRSPARRPPPPLQRRCIRKAR